MIMNCRVTVNGFSVCGRGWGRPGLLGEVPPGGAVGLGSGHADGQDVARAAPRQLGGAVLVEVARRDWLGHGVSHTPRRWDMPADRFRYPHRCGTLGRAVCNS
jgi:hypothetical protein